VHRKHVHRLNMKTLIGASVWIIRQNKWHAFSVYLYTNTKGRVFN